MKKKHGILPLLLSAVLVCALLLAGCGSADEEEETAVSASADSSADDTQEAAESVTESAEAEAEGDVIGEVSYVGSTYISVTVYTSEAEVEDYTLLDVSTLAATEETASVNTDDDTTYCRVEDGALADAVREDVTKGSVVAFTTSEDGAQQVIILAEAEEAEAEETDETAAEGLTGDETAAEEASGEDAALMETDEDAKTAEDASEEEAGTTESETAAEESESTDSL